MKYYAAMALAAIMLPFSFVFLVALELWELWHFGPSQWVLKGLRWLNYRAFKRVTNGYSGSERMQPRRSGSEK